METTLLQKRDTIDRVKSVFKVNFEDHFIDVSGVTLEPLADCVDANLRTQWQGHPNLKREQITTGFFLGAFTETFADKPAPGLAHRNWPNAPILFGQGGKRSTSQGGSDSGRRLT